MCWAPDWRRAGAAVPASLHTTVSAIATYPHLARTRCLPCFTGHCVSADPRATAHVRPAAPTSHGRQQQRLVPHAPVRHPLVAAAVPVRVLLSRHTCVFACVCVRDCVLSIRHMPHSVSGAVCTHKEYGSRSPPQASLGMADGGQAGACVCVQAATRQCASGPKRGTLM